VLSVSTRLSFRTPRGFITYPFGLAYIYIISSYIYGEMVFLIISIILFGGACFLLFTADKLFTVEPRLSRRASIALVTTGLCLYAPLPFLVLQGYLRLNPQYLREPGNLADLVFMVLILASVLLIYGLIRYKKSLVTETQRT